MFSRLKVVLLVCTACTACGAQTHRAHIYASMPDGTPVENVKVCFKGTGGCSDGTDPIGRDWIDIPPGLKPGDPIFLIAHPPEGIAVLDIGELAPNFDNPNSFIKVTCFRKGRFQDLQKPTVAQTIIKHINSETAKRVMMQQPLERAGQNAAEFITSKYGLQVSDVDNALKNSSLVSNQFMERAEAAFYDEDYQSAATLLGTALRSEHLNVQEKAHAWDLRGTAEFVLGNIEQAAEAFRRAYQLNPDDDNVRLSYAGLALLTSDSAAGQALAKQALSDGNLTDEDRFYYTLILVESRLRSNPTPELVPLLEKATTLSRDIGYWEEIFSACSLAPAFAVLGDIPRARELLNRAITNRLGNEDEDLAVKTLCLVSEAAVDFKDGMLTLAAEKLMKAKKIPTPGSKGMAMSNSFSLMLLLGEIKDEMGDYVGAEQVYRELYSLTEQAFGKRSPTYFIAVSRLINILRTNDKPRVALQIINQVPSDVQNADIELKIDLLEQKAIATAAIGNHRGAMLLLNQARALLRSYTAASKDDLLSAYVDLMDSYENLKSYAVVETIYKTAMALTDNDKSQNLALQMRLLTRIGRVYNKMRRYADSTEAFEKAVTLSHQITESTEAFALRLFYLARLAFDLHRYEEAITLYKQTLEIEGRVLGEDSPSVSITEYELGQSLFEMSMIREARDYLEDASSIQGEVYGVNDNRTLETELLLGWTFFELGDYDNSEAIAARGYRLLNPFKSDMDRRARFVAFINLLLRNDLKLKKLNSARKYLDQALQIANEMKDPKIQSDVWLSAVMVSLVDGNYVAAEMWAQRVAALCNRQFDHIRYNCAWAISLRGEAAFHRKNYDRARELLRLAERTFKEQHYELATALTDAYITQADLAHETGNKEAEKQSLQNVLAIRRLTLGADNLQTSVIESRISQLPE